MACNTPNCSDTSTAGTGANVVTVPQRACSGATFCDENLEGLPFSNGVDLVGVPEGDQCLHRVAAPAGVWQHDPARAGGADYVGPLNGLTFKPGENLATDECGHLPMLRDVTPAGGQPTVELVKQDVSVNSYGELASMTTCKGGKVRQDIIEPEVYDDANPCEANLSLLGFVRQVVIEGGVSKTRKVWKALTRILFPDTQISKFTGVDLTDGNSWRAVVAKKRGNCWEIGLDEEAEDTTDDCSLYASVGATFPYLLACDGGVMKKVEPQAGKSLVGDGSSWKLRTVGFNMLGTRHQIFSQSGTKPTVVTTEVDLTQVPGYVEGAQQVILDLSSWSYTTTQNWQSEISVEGITHLRIFHGASFDTQTGNNQVIVQIPGDGVITIGVTYVPSSANGSTLGEYWSTIHVAGFIG